MGTIVVYTGCGDSPGDAEGWIMWTAVFPGLSVVALGVVVMAQGALTDVIAGGFTVTENP